MKLWDRFTPREAEIAELLIKGKPWVDIARELGMSHRTIKTHSRWMYLKCGFVDASRLRHIQLVVALVYERWPELNPRIPKKAGP
jgi:DNA-binding NarL/FixJ family response regulator